MTKLKLKRTIKTIIIIIISLIILGMAAYFGSQYRVNSQSKPYLIDVANAPKCDAILVLGARVYTNGTVSPMLKDRLNYGYELYKNDKADKIIVSGDHGTKEYDEVNAMKKYLMELGVPREDIFMDHAGFDTYDSMYRARDIFQCKSLLVSTQNYHIYRAVYIAKQLGIEAYGYPSEDKEIYKMPYNNFRESLAKVKAVLETEIIRRKPKYLGEAIPIFGNGIETEG